MSSSSHHRDSRRKRRPPNSSKKEWTVAIQCRHCGLKFRANPFEARCPKCNCSANKPLSLQQTLLGVALPPFALAAGFVLRSHSPRAAFNSWISGGVGGTIWGFLVWLFSQGQ